MKNIERYIYIVLIIILVGVIASGATYIIMKNNDKTEIKDNDNKTNNEEKNSDQNKEPIKQDGVKLLKTYNLNDKIVEEFEITLNGKVKIMNITFEYQEDKQEMEVLSSVDGKFNNNSFICYSEIDSSKSNVFNLNTIKNKFNENNFKIIKGEDNESYLLVATNNTCGYGYESHLLVFNDNLEQIKGNFDSYSGSCSKVDSMIIASNQAGYKLENNLKPYYKNDFNIDLSDYQLSGINVKITNNKIYYLAPVIKESGAEGDYGVIEEREYSLNNNNLEYKITNSYKIIEVTAGQVC